MTCPVAHDGFDPTDPDLYTERVPLDELAELRRTDPGGIDAGKGPDQMRLAPLA